MSGRKYRRTHADLDADTGKPDMSEQHPLITCTPSVMEGHAHLKDSKVTVERVLQAELREIKGPIALASGCIISETQRRAVLRFSIAVIEDVSKLYAELDRRTALTSKTTRA